VPAGARLPAEAELTTRPPVALAGDVDGSRSSTEIPMRSIHVLDWLADVSLMKSLRIARPKPFATTG
jgi:hypothetical protein